MALSSHQYALKGQRLDKIQAQTAAPKVPEWPSYCNFGKVTQNPHFLKKCKGGTKGNFSKIAQESALFLTPKSTLAQMALSFNQYALNVQRLEKILAHKAAPKVPEWPSYGNFCKVTQNPHFLKKCKGGTKGNFQKSPKKQPSFERPKSTLAQMALSCNQYALKVQRLEKILWRKSCSKSARTAKLRQFSQGHPKPAFSEKVQRGDQGKFSKIAQEIAFV